MSNTIDERVVSMQFDNRHFESNVQTTMSTLDKFKQKLNFTGATKGLESVNAAASKVNFSEMEYAATKAGFQVQDIWLKVASVLEYQVAGRIINAAKRMTSALTIDPVKTGFQEYETQINAVQTILANTSSKGNLSRTTASTYFIPPRTSSLTRFHRSCRRKGGYAFFSVLF